MNKHTCELCAEKIPKGKEVPVYHAKAGEGQRKMWRHGKCHGQT